MKKTINVDGTPVIFATQPNGKTVNWTVSTDIDGTPYEIFFGTAETEGKAAFDFIKIVGRHNFKNAFKKIIQTEREEREERKKRSDEWFKELMERILKEARLESIGGGPSEEFKAHLDNWEQYYIKKYNLDIEHFGKTDPSKLKHDYSENFMGF